MAINDGALTYDERKALGWSIQKLVDDRVAVLQKQIDVLYDRRRQNTDIIAGIDKELEPMLRERNTLKNAREKLTW